MIAVNNLLTAESFRAIITMAPTGDYFAGPEATYQRNPEIPLLKSMGIFGVDKPEKT